MNQKFSKELYTQNYEVVRKSFKLEYQELLILGAMLYTQQGVQANADKIKECYRILKGQKGIFSAFRGHNSLPVIVRMSLADDPEAYLNGITAAYDVLKSRFVFGDEQIAMAAVILYEHTKGADMENAGQKAIEIYNQMRSQHPVLTSKEDLMFAVMMALSGVNADDRVSDAEASFEILKPKFTFYKDTLQTVGHLLALSDEKPEVKAERFRELFDAFKADGMKISKIEAPVFAVLANCTASTEEILANAHDYDAFFKTQKGFGLLGATPSTRRMIAAAVTAFDAMSDSAAAEAIGSVLLSLIIMVETIIITMIVSQMVSSSMAASM